MATSKKNSNPISKKIINNLVQQFAIEDDTVEQVLWLSRVLREISNAEFSKDFALMGGSAIVFLYSDLYRFSTDLDLDFVGNKNLGVYGKPEIKDQIKSDKEKLEGIAKSLGMKLKYGTDVKSLAQAASARFVQYVLEYPSLYFDPGRIEIDLSYRYCHTVQKPVMKPWPIVEDKVLPPFEVQTLSQEELFAGKIIAILGGKEMKRMDFPGKIGLFFKRKIRHLYDIYLLADNVERGQSTINIELLQNLIVLFGVSRIEDFGLYRGDSIVGYTDEDMSQELMAVVPKGKPVPGVKEVQWGVRQFLDRHVFQFSDAHYEFIEDFSKGLFRPKKLFSTSLANRIKGMFYYDEMLKRVKPLKTVR